MEVFVNVFSRLMENDVFIIIFKLVLIVILSGLVGYERSSWNKPAGFRTHVLVGISAALVMICGDYIYKQTGADPTRIPAQLLSGIGFLGAGTILRDGFNVKGLTTAAGLLAVTCIGLAVGAGFYIGAILSTIIVYFVISNSHIFSDALGHEHNSRLKLEITTPKPKELLSQITNVLNQYDVEIEKIRIADEDTIRVLFRVKTEIKTNTIIADLLSLDKVDQVLEI